MAADVVDLGIAHAGYPPTVSAYAGDRPVADLKAGSVARQIENLRVVAPAIDRLVLTAEGEAILNYIRSEPTSGRPSRKRRPASSA
jgi:hypothetical protein